jgi:glycosyltransferase involved in cell wall biosynthesis
MSCRRILLVLPDPPLSFGNAAARWYSVLCRELVARGHRVTTFAACCDEEEIAATGAMFPAPHYDTRCYLRPQWHGVFSKLESFRRPHSYLFSPKMKGDLHQELLRGFDILHLEQIWAAWAVPTPPRSSLVNVHYLFEIDMAGRMPQSIKERAVGIRSRQATRRLLRSFAHISTLSSRLTDAVRGISPGSEVNTVPLGIDVNLYPFVADRPPNRDPVVGLVGSFNWEPSYSAGRKLLDHLWPAIKSRVPNAKLMIAGRAAASAFAEYKDWPELTMYDNVPDIMPYFSGIDVLIYAPDHGSGMKVKVMEAFALGVAVVTNEQGVEGMPAADGTHAGICNHDRGLVDRTVALLSDSERRKRQRIAARKLIESHCGPKAVVDSLESLYANVMGGS